MSVEAIKHYEAALLEAFPRGASGDVFHHWNEARKAIAEAEKQEPVAWRFKTGTFWNREVHWRYVLSLEGTEGLQGLQPLYTSPPQRQPLDMFETEKLAKQCGVEWTQSVHKLCNIAAHGIKGEA